MASIVFNPADELFERLLGKTSINSILADVKLLSREDFQRLLDLLSDEYHNSQPVISDEDFDLLESLFVTRYGPNVKVGAPPRAETEAKKAPKTKASKAKAKPSADTEMVIRPSGARVQEAKLPIPMFGLDKPNDDHKLELYRKHYPDASFVVTDKLDGCAAELQLGPTSFLIKRGTEETGSDISYLLPYLDLPKVKATIMVRVELVMPTATYEAKYADEYKNPRNMVAGITNSKTIEAAKIRDLHVVAFHVYCDPPIQQSVSIAMLKAQGFRTPPSAIFKRADLTAQTLTAEIKMRKLRSPYEIDGVCIAADLPLVLPRDRNPEHVVAFKIVGETAATKVLRIEWEVNKHGIWFPVAVLVPVQLGGTTVERVSCYHANFVRNEGLGPDSEVLVHRSGDTIPQILQTLKRVPPQMPEKDWAWVEKEDGSDPVDVRFTGEFESREQRIAKIVAFFEARGTEYLSDKTITRLYDADIDTLKDVFNADLDEVMEIDGFGSKSAERLLTNIQKAIKNAPLAQVMHGSCLFPRSGPSGWVS